MQRVQQGNNFLRSTNLSADLDNVHFAENIMVTEPMLRTVATINSSVTGESKDSAITLVGPFGSGKSTTAVVALGFLQGLLAKSLYQDFGKKGIVSKIRIGRKDIIDVVGERVSLSQALDKAATKFLKKRSGIVSAVRDRLDSDKSSPIIIVIDEFGKFLEYSADHPAEGDVYVLQELAELSHRSEGRFILVTIRHQGLQTYLNRLQSPQLKEWYKIQGRFLEIVHANTLDETLRILGNAIRRLDFDSRKTPASILKTLRRNPLLGQKSVEEVLSNCYPVHPYAALLLVSVFKKLAQNERSLFSFLATSEPYGLRSFLRGGEVLIPYEIADLHEYLEHNLRHTMVESDISSMWSMIGTSVASFRSKCLGSIDANTFEKAVRLIKTIGMIDVFGKEAGLYPTRLTIENALYGNFKSTRRTFDHSLISLLEENSLITFRRLFESYHLWQGSDLNIDTLISEEIDGFGPDFNYSGVFNRYFDQPPVVARKLHIETGTFRYVTWHYAHDSDEVDATKVVGDGLIHCIVAEDVSSRKYAEHLGASKTPDNILVLRLLLSKQNQETIKTYVAIQNLLDNYQPLIADKVARRELEQLRVEYRQRIEDIFQGSHSSPKRLEYLNDNGSWEIITWDELGRLVSRKLKNYFKYTPRIQNELINTDSPSPSAIVGLKKLLTAMVENPDKEQFGIEGTGPEYSMYLNVFSKTRIHRQENGQWGLFQPTTTDDGLSKVWNNLTRLLKKTRESRVPISLAELEESIKEAPYGLRRGLAKLLVFANVLAHSRNVSLYEEGTFTPKIHIDTLQRMIKLPDRFSAQYVETGGVHQYLFRKLYETVTSKRRDSVTLLEVVTPLVQFANRLPYYTKHTRLITDSSKEVLQSLLTATQPEMLIYNQLPKALGMEEVTEKTDKSQLDTYLERLQSCIHELRDNKDRLLQDCLIHLRKTWGLTQKDMGSIRTELCQRFSPEVVSLITDEKLKAISNRVLDDALPDNQWFTSLAALMVNKPMDRWNDSDKELYISELQLRFLQTEETQRFARLQRLSTEGSHSGAVEIARKVEESLARIRGTAEEKLAAIAEVYDKMLRGEKIEH